MSGFSTQDNVELYHGTVNSEININETTDDKLSTVYELDKCISWVAENNFERTCLQFPDKMLNDGVSVAMYLEKILGRPFYILADTAFGSCCVDHISAEHVNADSIIHFGHACMSAFSKIPVLYVFEKEELNVRKVKNFIENTFKNNYHILIFYDDIYHHLYDTFCETFKGSCNIQVARIKMPQEEVNKNGKARILYGRLYQIFCEGNVAGIFLGNDCILLQNLALALPNLKWYYFGKDEELKDYDINRSKFLMKKYHQIELIKDAGVIGILIGTLGIENYLNAIERVKVLVKKKGKKCYIFAVGRPNVNKLANFPEIDIFVSIACSENVSKDFKEYYKPVVSLFEVEMALGDHSFSEEYITDFREIVSKYSVLNEKETSCETEVSLTSGKLRTTRLHHGNIESQELQEKMPGTLVEAKGAEFLSKRSWRGLERNLENKEVTRAETGRSGIPLNYENELKTLGEKDST